MSRQDNPKEGAMDVRESGVYKAVLKRMLEERKGRSRPSHEEVVAEINRVVREAEKEIPPPFLCNPLPNNSVDSWVYAQGFLRELRERLSVDGHIEEAERKAIQQVLDVGRRMQEEIVERREELRRLKSEIGLVFDIAERLRKVSR